jgi:hypothetical protein
MTYTVTKGEWYIIVHYDKPEDLRKVFKKNVLLTLMAKQQGGNNDDRTSG